MRSASRLIKSSSSNLITDAPVSVVRDALFATGSRTTGNKSLLLQRLSWELHSLKSRSTVPSKAAKLERHGAPSRIISIDMGIRNLAFVVCDVAEYGTTADLATAQNAAYKAVHDHTGVIAALARTGTNEKPEIKAFDSNLPRPHITVQHWTRVALDQSDPDANAAIAGKETLIDLTPSLSAEIKSPDKDDPYHPSQLSRTATSLLKHLLSYNPDVIIIERQRHRSGGGAAIQEWTVRVNALEAMLWAGLRMKSSMSNDGESANDILVYGVNPATVAQFWVPGKTSTPTSITEDEMQSSEGSSSSKTIKKGASSRKIEKKDKIAVAAGWLKASATLKTHGSDLSIAKSAESGADSLEISLPPFSLSFEGQAATIRDSFLSRWQNGQRKKPTRSVSQKSESGTAYAESPAEVKKLDDLADCLLQAGAWITWQRNREILAQTLEFTPDEAEMITTRTPQLDPEQAGAKKVAPKQRQKSVRKKS